MVELTDDYGNLFVFRKYLVNPTDFEKFSWHEINLKFRNSHNENERNKKRGGKHKIRDLPKTMSMSYYV